MMVFLKRPSMSDEGFIDTFCMRYAYFLFRLENKPKFIQGMTLIEVHEKLKSIGKPTQYVSSYKAELESAGFNEVANEDLLVVKKGLSLFEALYNQHVEQWVTEEKITIPYPDGQEVFELSSQGEQGYIYLDPELSARAMVLFRSKEHIEKHGNTGGIPVCIETLVTIGEPDHRQPVAKQVNNF